MYLSGVHINNKDLFVGEEIKKEKRNNHLSHRCYRVCLPGADPKLGSLVDLPVDEEHHAQRQVKRSKGGEDGVRRLLAHLALHSLRVGPTPAEERGQGDDGGQQPREGDHHIGDLFACLQRVLQVPGDGPVTVQRDGCHVPDAGRAAEHVEGDPHLAEDAAQLPQPPVQLVDQAQRHDQGGHHHVRDGHGSYQVVGHPVECPHAQYGHQHQQVPHEGGHHQHGQQGEREHTKDREGAVDVSAGVEAVQAAAEVGRQDAGVGILHGRRPLPCSCQGHKDWETVSTGRRCWKRRIRKISTFKVFNCG